MSIYSQKYGNTSACFYSRIPAFHLSLMSVMKRIRMRSVLAYSPPFLMTKSDEIWNMKYEIWKLDGNVANQ